MNSKEILKQEILEVEYVILIKITRKILFEKMTSSEFYSN